MENYTNVTYCTIILSRNAKLHIKRKPNITSNNSSKYAISQYHDYINRLREISQARYKMTRQNNYGK